MNQNSFKIAKKYCVIYLYCFVLVAAVVEYSLAEYEHLKLLFE